MGATLLPDSGYINARIDEALREDGADSDCTVSFLGIAQKTVSGRLLARGDGVIAGLEIASAVFARMSESVRFDARISEGDRVRRGDIVAEVTGPAGPILSGERVALNFLQRLSGVATLTAIFVDAVRGTTITILDTRKTTPLLRKLERYAVRVGGGANHRYNLSDMILVKENHVASLGGGSALRDVLANAKADRAVEVEVENLESLRSLLGLPVDRVMLDNFSPGEARRAIAEIKAYQKAHPHFTPEIEISGGIDLDNIGAYVIEGLDFISVGALTHSAVALDMSLEVDGRDG